MSALGGWQAQDFAGRLTKLKRPIESRTNEKLSFDGRLFYRIKQEWIMILYKREELVEENDVVGQNEEQEDGDGLINP
jgi:hypothetical protein